MELLLPALSGLTVAVMFLALFRPDREAAVGRRIDRLGESNVIETPLALPFAQRMIYPGVRRLAAASPAPGRLARAVRRRLEQAGSPITPASFFMIWASAGVALPGLLLLATLADGRLPNLRGVAAMATLAAIGLYIPWTWLRRKAATRRKAITKALPDVIDLLITNVEAGLGLQSALLVVADKARGPLSVEFSRVVREVSLGRPRTEALADMGARLDLPEARLLARAMIQAEQTGIPIARVLRNHSREMRERRQVLARNRAAKLPVKMVMATVAFMFPTLFILLIGPVVLNVISVFSKS